MMKNLKKKAFVALTAGLALSLCLGVSAVAASAEENTTPEWAETVSMAMEKGASVRLNEVSGIRYKANITGYDATAGLTYGMIIVPVDLLNAAGIAVKDVTVAALDAAGVQYINAEAEVNVDGESAYIQHSIANLKTGNYDRTFLGLGYVTDGTYYEYAAENDNQRAITYVASAALNKFNYDYDSLSETQQSSYAENQSLMEGFITTAVSTHEFDPSLSGNGNLYAGDKTKATLGGLDGISLEWVWESSNADAATVSAGEVKAVNGGSATITAKSAGLYQKTLDVTVTNEDGVVVPFNRATAKDYVGDKGAAVYNLESVSDTTYNGEDYALRVTAEPKKSGRWFNFNNSLITDLNEKKDGKYVYNYVSFAVRTNAFPDLTIKFNNNSDSQTPITQNDWTEIKLHRVNGSSTFYVNGDTTKDAFAGDYASRVSEFNSTNITFDATSTSPVSGWVWFSAIRAGYDAQYEADEAPKKEIPTAPVVAVPFNTASATNYVNTSSKGAAISSFTTNSDSKYLYSGEAYSFRLSFNSYASSGRWFKLANLTEVVDLNDTDANGNYLYDYLVFRVYACFDGLTVTFNNSNATATINNRAWTEVKCVRGEGENADKFYYNGNDMFDGNADRINDLNNLSFAFNKLSNQSSQTNWIFFSALYVGNSVAEAAAAES